MAANSRLQTLFEKYMNNTCTKEEWNELLLIAKEEDNEAELEQAFKNYWNTLPATVTAPHWNEMFSIMMQQAKDVIAKPGVSFGRPQADDTAPGDSFGRPQGDIQHGVSRTRQLRQHGVSRTRQHGVSRSGPRVIQMYWKYIAAASVIIIASLIVILTLSKNDNGTKPTAQQSHDVPAPNNTRAVITLADGSKVYLDSVSNGTIAQENNVNILRNSEGEIQYMSPAGGGELNDSQNRKRPGVVYNTLFNPRGSKVISLTLSDGTKVWLNSESSLRYPASFSAPDSYRGSASREVFITGEAYFEVKHNSKQPFKVHLPNGSVVEDIGTAFNVNAYTDEEATKTTLIEGSIAVSLSGVEGKAKKQILKPGQQAVVYASTPLSMTTNGDVDIDAIVSWRTGWFEFDNITLPTILRQISRWYDVEVVYTKSAGTEKFGGRISKDLPLSNVLRSLEQNSKTVKFRIDGKRLFVE